MWGVFPDLSLALALNPVGGSSTARGGDNRVLERAETSMARFVYLLRDHDAFDITTMGVLVNRWGVLNPPDQALFPKLWLLNLLGHVNGGIPEKLESRLAVYLGIASSIGHFGFSMTEWIFRKWPRKRILWVVRAVNGEGFSWKFIWKDYIVLVRVPPDSAGILEENSQGSWKLVHEDNDGLRFLAGPNPKWPKATINEIPKGGNDWQKFVYAMEHWPIPGEQFQANGDLPSRAGKVQKMLQLHHIIPDWTDIVYIPSSGEMQTQDANQRMQSFVEGSGGLILIEKRQDAIAEQESPSFRALLDRVKYIHSGVQQVYGAFAREDNDRVRQHFALRSARAAIMSRNMSHNLGSHVLSRLGRQRRGGGWYTQRYLQQRMDFLAQVSTEPPSGDEPAWVLQDLVRWFLHQTDILDFIAASEGLRAHRFKPGETRGNQDKDSADIRLHVLLVPDAEWSTPCPIDQNMNADKRIDERIKIIREACERSRADGSPEEALSCIPNTGARQEDGADCRRVLLSTKANEEDKGTVCTDEDQLVAIPGGLVGWQGFYVVLENVMRNAAKHGKREQGKPLHVVVEILHDPDCTLSMRYDEQDRVRVAPCLLVRIYDSASPVRDGGVALWARGKTPGDCSKGLNERLQQDFIDETGKLVQGNWGLFEMRIAAGFLQRRSIDHVGGGGERVTGPPPPALCQDEQSAMDRTMLEAAKNDASPYILRAVPSPIGTLAYEFYLLRPLSMGIAATADEGAAAGGAS